MKEIFCAQHMKSERVKPLRLSSKRTVSICRGWWSTLKAASVLGCSGSVSPMQHSNQELLRAQRLIARAVDKYDLDLGGLNVFTEAATGPYRFTPLLCALAGARSVYALARDTPWGTAAKTVSGTSRIARDWGVEDRVHFLTEKRPGILAHADILTNSGNVRPIDRKTVGALKPTCVIPLMWETWEFRPEELDLDACREKGVLVLGTNEEAIDFRWFTGIVLLRMILDSGFEVYGNRLLVISSSPVCRAICRALYLNGADFRWTSLEESPVREYADRFIPPNARVALLEYAATADACICDDRRELGLLIGEGGIVTPRELAQVNPGITIINRSGTIDAPGLLGQGIRLFPARENRKGYPNATAASLGMSPVIELVAAGLKVGEVTARARLKGLPPEQAALLGVEQGNGQDFPGADAWITPNGVAL